MTPREFMRWKVFHAEHPLDDRQRLIYPAALVSYFAGNAFGKRFEMQSILDMFMPNRNKDDPDVYSFAHIAKVFKEA